MKVKKEMKRIEARQLLMGLSKTGDLKGFELAEAILANAELIKTEMKLVEAVQKKIMERKVVNEDKYNAAFEGIKEEDKAKVKEEMEKKYPEVKKSIEDKGEELSGLYNKKVTFDFEKITSPMIKDKENITVNNLEIIKHFM